MPPKYDKGPICSTMGEKRHVNYIVIENYKYIFKNGVTMTKFGKRFGVHNFNKKVATFLWWVVGNCIMTRGNLKDRI